MEEQKQKSEKLPNKRKRVSTVPRPDEIPAGWEPEEQTPGELAEIESELEAATLLHRIQFRRIRGKIFKQKPIRMLAFKKLLCRNVCRQTIKNHHHLRGDIPRK